MSPKPIVGDVFHPWPRPRLSVAGGGTFPVHNVICVGGNYRDHAREMGGDPERQPPVFFSKGLNAVVGAPRGDAPLHIAYPAGTNELHHEVELVAALGAEGRLFGVAVGIDFTRRDLQSLAKKAGKPWFAAKSFSGAAPVGLIHPVADGDRPRKGRITLEVDGEVRQDGDIGDMIWDIDEILTALRASDDLYPGDLIFTGTPAGVGPVGPNQTLVARIEGVGGLDVRIDPPRRRHDG